MNGRMAKKIRKEARRNASSVYADAMDYKRVMNTLPLIDRIKVAVRLLFRRF